MDSVSQFALGAAIGEATLGRKLGRKSMILGGLLGTLPDLDVLVSYVDAVAGFTYHRSWSHSVFTLTLVSPLLAWLLCQFYPERWLKHTGGQDNLTSNKDKLSYASCLLCVWLVLITHPFLDGFTVYGTQLFWPMPVKPVAWGSIFIIDPLYTLPLLIGLLIAWRNRSSARKAVLFGLMFSTGYLLLTLWVQQHARQLAERSLQQQSLGIHNVLIAPSPFSMLWRIVSMDGDSYHEGFYSVFDNDKEIRFTSYPSNRQLITEHSDHWPVARLDWFTNGMISASTQNKQLVINDLRMGIEANYVFRFSVGELESNAFTPSTATQMPIQFDRARMANLLHRVWDENRE